MAIWLKFKVWIVAIGAAIAGIIGVYFYGRKSGSMQEAQRQTEKDIETARDIQDAADRVRRADGDNVDPIERLRTYKRLRDIKNNMS
jgi:hypothetical protein